MASRVLSFAVALAGVFALAVACGACSEKMDNLPPVDNQGVGRPTAGGAGAETPGTTSEDGSADDGGTADTGTAATGACGIATCTGCCTNASPSVCVAGTSAAACGSNGQQCQPCGGGGVCQSNDASPAIWSCD